jgi:hypothetical protein
MSNRVLRVLFWVGVIYLGALVVCVGVGTMLPSPLHPPRNSAMACYWTDALVIYVDCQGFGAAEGFVKGALNFPLQLVYRPMFGLYSTSEPSAPIGVGVLMLAQSILLWAPLIYILWYILWPLVHRAGTRERSS